MEKIKIYSVTWNANARDPPANLDCSQLLNLPVKGDDVLPDIYSVGFQEVNSRFNSYFVDSFVNGEDPWTKAVRAALAPHGYVKIRTIRLLGIVLSIFVLRNHLIHIKNMETQYTRLSLGGYLGLKGGVSVRFSLYGISICFVNSHLSAHDHLLERRIEEYNSLVEYHTFKQEVTTHILYHDYVIWCGDLNFRLEENAFNFQQIVNAIADNELAGLLARDQLTMVRQQERAFHELSETLPTFNPTYKFIVGTPNYDPKRRPAWCDRILFRVNQSYDGITLNIEQSNYRSHPEGIFQNCSDHLPVSSCFEILVFGRELARERRIDDYGSIINFMSPGGELDEEDRAADLEEQPQWFIGEEANVMYTLESGAGLYLNAWDWIGLYKDGFTSFEDYVAFCYASSCRRTGIPKTAMMPDSTTWSPGRYVLIYFSAKGSVLGISQPFAVGLRPVSVLPIPVEDAEEAEEDE